MKLIETAQKSKVVQWQQETVKYTLETKYINIKLELITWILNHIGHVYRVKMEFFGWLTGMQNHIGSNWESNLQEVKKNEKFKVDYVEVQKCSWKKKINNKICIQRKHDKLVTHKEYEVHIECTQKMHVSI